MGIGDAEGFRQKKTNGGKNREKGLSIKDVRS